jgi:hypothetical protein
VLQLFGKSSTSVLSGELIGNVEAKSSGLSLCFNDLRVFADSTVYMDAYGSWDDELVLAQTDDIG